MTNGKDYHVFLSHSSKDMPFVRRLAAELESHGVKVWRDETEMSLGDSLFDHIAKGIEKAEYFAIVLSIYSNESKWVRKELKAALNRELDEGRTFVIPILIEDVEIPTFLRGKIYADFRSEDQFDLSLRKLLKKFGVDDKDLVSIEDKGNKGKPAKPYPRPMTGETDNQRYAVSQKGPGDTLLEVASVSFKYPNMLVGQTLDSRFRIERNLMDSGADKGGIGLVYLAQDIKLMNKEVVVKILQKTALEENDLIRKFLHEKEALIRLDHPNIVRILDSGTLSDGNPFMVMEYIEGHSLRRELSNKRQLSFESAAHVIECVSDALSMAHAKKILHRDVKPANIMLTPQEDGFDRVRLIDFGIARVEESELAPATIVQGLVGTPHYMAPEQLAGGLNLTPATDVYATAIVAYELLTGDLPFKPQSIPEMYHLEKEGVKIAPRQLRPDLSEEAEQILLSALEFDPTARPQNARAFGRELAAALRRRLQIEDQTTIRDFPDLTTKREELLSPPPSERTWKSSLLKWIIAARGGSVARQYVLAGAAIILLMAAGFGYYSWYVKRTVPGPAVKRTLGVLPFVNSGHDPNAEYLSDGLTESIRNKLSQLSGLTVMSRNSSFRFKNSQTDEKNIAAQLGVETLVTGEIRQVGDKLVINVGLIDARDASQIWGDKYVRSLNDIITTENEIAQAVAQNLRLKLSNTETELLRKNYTDNVEAYQLYIRGRFHIYKNTVSEVQKGMSDLEQAIAIDPNYAPAYTGLSEGYRSLAVGNDMFPAEYLSKSVAMAQRAIGIDDGYSQGHSALATAIFWGEWDWAAAEKEFERAIYLDPNNSNAHMFYAHLLSNTGRHEKALAEARTAKELDPVSPFVNALEGQFLIHAGRSDEGLVQLSNTFDLDPYFWMPHLFASSAYIEKGMYAEAVVEARKARELSATQTHSYTFESYALAKWGKTDEARAVCDALLKIRNDRWVPPSQIALAYNGLNDTDETFAWLERGFEEHDPKMVFLKVEPKWNNLRSDPRFAELIRKMNF